MTPWRITDILERLIQVVTALLLFVYKWTMPIPAPGENEANRTVKAPEKKEDEQDDNLMKTNCTDGYLKKRVTELEEASKEKDRTIEALVKKKAEQDGNLQEKDRTIEALVKRVTELEGSSKTVSSQSSGSGVKKFGKTTKYIYIMQVNQNENKDEEEFIQKFKKLAKVSCWQIEATKDAVDAHPILLVCKCTSDRYNDEINKCTEVIKGGKIEDRAAIIYFHMENWEKKSERLAAPPSYPGLVFHMTFYNSDIKQGRLGIMKDPNKTAMSEIHKFVQDWYEKRDTTPENK